MGVSGPLLHGFGYSLGDRLLIIPKPGTDEYNKFLADDKNFLTALTQRLNQGPNNGNNTQLRQQILDAAAANVANLTVEERAQILNSAPYGLANNGNSFSTNGTNPTLALINQLANNQGYSGPNANVVAATINLNNGSSMAVTNAQLLDDEGFVILVYTAAGGTKPVGLLAPPFGSGLPGSAFSPPQFNSPLWGANISNWSGAERVAYLQKVAEFAKDGVIDAKENAALRDMAMSFSRSADGAPVAVTLKPIVGNPQPISADNLMENSTFENTLNSQAAQGFLRPDNAEMKALRDAIATADYNKLSYEERVALIEAFNTANADGRFSAYDAKEITTMIRQMQTNKPNATASAAPGAAGPGQTLSNGLFVSNSAVATSANFMSSVNAVLDRSGVPMPSSNNVNAFGDPMPPQPSGVRMLQGLNTSKLTAEQRMQVLEMIAKAGADRQITVDEAREIVKAVNQMSGFPANALLMYP
jgi:hypothetical protein